ncbi:MAG: hypothetical protein AAF402_08860 [Pseudomonadota bacterium]
MRLLKICFFLLSLNLVACATLPTNSPIIGQGESIERVGYINSLGKEVFVTTVGLSRLGNSQEVKYLPDWDPASTIDNSVEDIFSETDRIRIDKLVVNEEARLSLHRRFGNESLSAYHNRLLNDVHLSELTANAGITKLMILAPSETAIPTRSVYARGVGISYWPQTWFVASHAAISVIFIDLENKVLLGEHDLSFIDQNVILNNDLSSLEIDQLEIRHAELLKKAENQVSGKEPPRLNALIMEACIAPERFDNYSDGNRQILKNAMAEMIDFSMLDLSAIYLGTEAKRPGGTAYSAFAGVKNVKACDI